MATYESIIITKKASNIWVFNDNTLPDDAFIFANVYSDLVEGDLISFKTKTGGNVYNEQPYSIFEYVDELNSGNNFTPTSALQLHAYLLNDGFFGDSSGGGGGATTLLELLDVLIATYVGNQNKILAINSTGTGIIAIDAGTFVQNNVPRFFTYYIGGTGVLTLEEFVETINTTFSSGFFTISEINTPVIFTGIKDGYTYRYLFVSGKGIYPTISESNLRFLLAYPTEPSDIESDPDAVIIPLEGVVDGDFLAVANLTEWDFSDSGEVQDDGGVKTYYFSYTDDGIEYFVRFIGDSGEYGGANPPFTSDMFTSTTNSGVTIIPTLQQVTDSGNVTNDNITAKAFIATDGTNTAQYEEARISINTGDLNINFPDDKTGEQTMAMVSDLPLNVSGTGFVRIRKGWQGVDFNTSDENEKGDLFSGAQLDLDDNVIYYYPETRWIGTGDINDIANHKWDYRAALALDDE